MHNPIVRITRAYGKCVCKSLFLLRSHLDTYTECESMESNEFLRSIEPTEVAILGTRVFKARKELLSSERSHAKCILYGFQGFLS